MEMNIQDYVRQELFAMQDLTYKEFHGKLMPNIEENRIIGVRVPMLRSFVKKLVKREDSMEFLNNLPHQYYEENNVHGLLIGTVKDYEECINMLDNFLPYVDNWATCDMLSPKVLGKHKEQLHKQCLLWMKSDHTYTIRFGIEMMMSHFLDEDFRSEYLEEIAKLRSDEYYVNMMIAWYFATALAKQYNATIPYIEQKRLAQDTHNKTIQKAVESYRITPEQKEYLRSLKIKKEK